MDIKRNLKTAFAHFGRQFCTPSTTNPFFEVCNLICEQTRNDVAWL